MSAFGAKADITAVLIHVRFRGQASRIKRQLSPTSECPCAVELVAECVLI